MNSDQVAETIARVDRNRAGVASDRVDLDLIANERAGARAETKRLARNGPTGLANRSDVGDRRRQMAQYRACQALMWTREKILEQTGWSTQLLMAVEKLVAEDDKRAFVDLDPKTLFAEYKLQQFQAAQELEDLAEVFRSGSQYNALVAAVKARSDILDRVLKAGQDLGVVKRAAREVSVTSNVNFQSMSVEELRVHLIRERGEVERLLEPPRGLRGLAGTVLERVLAPAREARVRRLREEAPAAPETALDEACGPESTPEVGEDPPEETAVSGEPGASGEGM